VKALDPSEPDEVGQGAASIDGATSLDLDYIDDIARTLGLAVAFSLVAIGQAGTVVPRTQRRRPAPASLMATSPLSLVRSEC